MIAAGGRDHGGGVDAAAARFGGARDAWLDLSTGINPCPYPVASLSLSDWAALPDRHAAQRLEAAARAIWAVPAGAAVLAAPGASALIARIPALAPAATVCIPGPTYNEHAASFARAGWQVTASPDAQAAAQVRVHPNNPDGRLWTWDTVMADPTALTVIDESFCDVCPERTLMPHAADAGTLVLKSFGKFWGLAGVRLGFAIGDPRLIESLRDMLGPWPVSGPAMAIGAQALSDVAWARTTRARLARDAPRLDAIITRAGAGATVAGGTPLFRLYEVADATRWQERLAQAHIWSRTFPYTARWLRLGLPGTAADWDRVEAAV